MTLLVTVNEQCACGYGRLLFFFIGAVAVRNDRKPTVKINEKNMNMTINR